MTPCEYLDFMIKLEQEFHHCLTRDWEFLVKAEFIPRVRLEEIYSELKSDSELYWNFKRELEDLFFNFKEDNSEEIVEIFSEISVNRLKTEMDYLVKIYKDVAIIFSKFKREDLASWFEEWVLSKK